MNCVGGKQRAPMRALLLAVLLIFCSTGWSQATQSQATQPASIEDQPLIKSGGTSSSHDPSNPTTNKPGSFLDMMRVVYAMAIVLGLIFALRWAAKKFIPGVATRGAVALAAADAAAADSTTSVTGTSMTFSTSAPTATGTALKDGPYK